MNKQEYLETKIKPIMENLIFQLVLERPEEPAVYMIDWLQKTAGYNLIGLKPEEKEELARLRKEIIPYRQKARELNPNGKESDEEEEDEIYDPKNVDKKVFQNIDGRKGVSAESYGQFNKKEKFIPIMIHKTEEQINSIKQKIRQGFLFDSLEAKDITIIIGAMDEKNFHENEVVIRQGDEGDCLYIVEKGEFDCYKTDQHGKRQKIKTYRKGDLFGELALLYNSPRAADIISTTESTVWSLDRDTFNNIVKESARMKREKYEAFLKSVEILSTMDDYEIGVVSDALKRRTFREGEFIIRQGEVGDVFYIIEEGEAYAFGNKEHGKASIPEMNYTKGNYFGELALLRDQPRAANVKAKTDVKLLALDRNSFKRVLGPIDQILKRNAEKYKKFVNHGK